LKGITLTILDDVQGYIERYVSLPNKGVGLILSTYVLHTWTFGDGQTTAKTTPYLYVNSSERRAGKSTLLEVLGTLVRNPFKALDATGPVLFRAIEHQDQPTVMFDEADTIWYGRGQGPQNLRNVINGGYKIGGHIYRTSGKDVVKYNTFCPKVLAGIYNGKLPDTIADRAIPVMLRRKPAGALTEPFFASDVDGEVEPMLDTIEAWVAENATALKAYRLHAVSGMGDRQAEIIWPLLAIAEQFGRKDELIKAIRDAFSDFESYVVANDESLAVLREISEIFEAEGNKVHADTLLAYLDMTSKQLAVELAAFNVSPKPVRIGNKVSRGFTLDQFMTTFEEVGIR